MNKICSTCNVEKSIDEFDCYDNVVRHYCKDCRKEKDRIAATKRRLAKGIAPVKNTKFNCLRCGIESIKYSIHTKHCKDCQNIVNLERARKSSLNKARERENRILGTICQCENCNKNFVLLKPKSIYCEECKVLQKKNALPKMKDYSKQYIKKYMADENNKKNAFATSYKYLKNKRKTDPVFVLSERIRARIGQAFRCNGYTKRSSTYEILGCSFDFLKGYLEAKFKDGMNWDNRNKWHIDHIIPLASAKTEDDVIRLNHYTNLQPLWAIDNLRKSNKII